MIAGLRAAIQGVPFMPMAGLTGSDLLAAAGFKTVADPYSGAEVAAIPAIRPDWCLVHCQEADEDGNVRIFGPRYDDPYKAKASRGVIVTAERLVDGAELQRQPELTTIPGFMVRAVVVAPGGARPMGCHGEYLPDAAFLRRYLEAASTDAGFDAFMEEALGVGAGQRRPGAAPTLGHP